MQHFGRPDRRRLSHEQIGLLEALDADEFERTLQTEPSGGESGPRPLLPSTLYAASTARSSAARSTRSICTRRRSLRRFRSLAKTA